MPAPPPPALVPQDLPGALPLSTLEQCSEAVVISDERHRIVFFNTAAEALWGISRREALGAGLEMLGPWIPRMLQESRTGPADIPIDRPHGVRLWASLSLSRIVAAGRQLHAAFLQENTAQRALQERAWQLSLVADSSGSAIIVTGPDLRITYVNQGFTRLLGYRQSEAMGHFPIDLLSGPDTDGLVADTVRDFAVAGQELQTQALVYASNGRPLWVSLVMNPVWNADGKLEHMVGVLTEITHTKMHEVLQYKVLDAMARDAPLGDIARLLCQEVEHIAPEVVTSLCRVDSLGRLRVLSAPGLTGQAQSLLEGHPIGPHAPSCATAAWSGRTQLARDIATDPGWGASRQSLLAQGLHACWSSPVKGTNGAVLGSFALYYRDMQEPSALHERLVDVVLHLSALLLERERERAHIHQLAHFDALTGLANRHMLLSQTQSLLQDMLQANACLALVFVDLDHFKEVNDTWGHRIGDRVLRVLAARLKKDMPGDAVVGRLGGDEFVIVLPHCPPHQAALSARQLLAGIGAPLPLQGTQVLHPTASLGIAMFPEDGTDAETLLHHADLAMYQAKTHGRRGYCFYREQMNTLVQERSRLASDLRVALSEGGLQLHYQPQVRNLDAAHTLCGVEALSRWEHPQLGPVSPVRFVALAEELGLMDALSEWVVHEACRQLAIWRRQAVAIPHVCINLSASNLRNGRLPLQIASALRQHGLLPGDLRIEVTETTVLEHHPMVLATARALHDHGVLLSMDDFGTGYSSLAALQHLPISVLKLDKSFIQDIGKSRSARALTEAVLHIGESLGLEVVAEGVETEDQRALLQQLGCPVVQGYLFARAMPPAQLSDWMASHG